MAVAFSTDGANTIHRTLIEKDQNYGTLADNWDDPTIFFELDRCKSWIEAHSFTKVALQFPDELLSNATYVVKELQLFSNAELVVLADTSYGSCCVDEVAGEHTAVDALIHFGRSCLSPSRRLPVLHVLGKLSIDTEDCAAQLLSLVPADLAKPLVLIVDVDFCHKTEALTSLLKDKFPSLLVPVLALPPGGAAHPATRGCLGEDSARNTDCHPQDSGLTESRQCSDATGDRAMQFVKFGRTFSLPSQATLDDCDIMYVGEENMFLSNLLMTCNKCSCYTYMPGLRTCRREARNVNKQLMKRYYLVERVKDAKVIGILIGTLGVADYLSMLDRLKTLIKHAGKKSYIFSVGKLNVPKLANFMEVDVFVLVACPENSLLDSAEFYKPVVTPFELELACHPDRQWTGEFHVDYRELLPGGLAYKRFDENAAADFQMDMSLVTGGVRRMGLDTEEDKSGSGSTALAARDNLAVSSLSGDFLPNRSWRGLEPQLGQTEVTKAIQGTKGTAMHYASEPGQ